MSEIYGLHTCVDVTAAVLAEAITKSEPAVMRNQFDLTLTPAQVVTIIANLNNLQALAPGSILQLPDGIHQIPSFVDCKNPFFCNLTLKAAVSTTIVTCSGVSAPTGSAKNWSITFTGVSDTSEITEGRFVRIYDSEETGDLNTDVTPHHLVTGEYEVLAKTANTVTVKAPLDITSFPTITLTSAKIKPKNVILKWALGSRGFAINHVFEELREITFAGSFDFSSNPPADGPEDGLMIGDQANTSNTGLTESQQMNFGAAWMTNIGVVNWPNNGLQIKGGTVNAPGTAVSGCGWRGCQVANNGVGVFKGIIVSGCGQGVQTEGGAHAVYSNGFAHGNTQQGVYAIGGKQTTTNFTSTHNGTHGLEAKNLSEVLADGFRGTDNLGRGVSCIDSRVTVGNGAKFADNTDDDTYCFEGGSINGKGAASLGSISVDHESGASVIDTDGMQLYPNAIRSLETESYYVRNILTSAGNHILDLSGDNRWEFRKVGHFWPIEDDVQNIGSASERIQSTFSKEFRPGDGGPIWTSGSGSPEGAVAASIGSLYTRTDGGAGTTLYVKESGTSGSTGWVAK